MKKTLIIFSMILALCSCSHNSMGSEETIAVDTGYSSVQMLSATPIVTLSQTTTISETPPKTIAPSQTPFERTNVMNNPKIVIHKSERMLYVYDDDNLCAKFKIALGFAPEGHKQKEGDGKTPEGEYYICTKNDKSNYYLGLAVSYPNIIDAGIGLESGLITQSEYDKIESAINSGKRPPWDTALGGEIVIHGSDASRDWTAGCIAAENSDIDYLWENCPVGTPITITP